jgi:hypothetical protein
VSQHCLYCDRPLALLKRLTGDGEFCSKEHRKIYQKEHNQLALARLLESQPKPKGKQRPSPPEDRQPPAPVAAPPPVPEPVREPVPKKDERLPEQAGFISDFLREASAVSEPHRLTEVRKFQSAAPVLRDSQTAQGSPDQSKFGPQPKAAAFVTESPMCFAVEVRFPGKSDLEPLASRPRLAEGLPAVNSGVGLRRGPRGAGSVPEQIQFICGPVSAPRHTSRPQFSPLAPAKLGAEPVSGGFSPRLPLASFVFSFTIGARSIPERVRNLTTDPRWKPLAAAIPGPPIGKIILVLGSFLQRPVRVAGQDGLPESFEIRLRPISFPPFSPGMGILEERLHRTDRIGFTPP